MVTFKILKSTFANKLFYNFYIINTFFVHFREILSVDKLCLICA